jgi:hypothetical protein
MAKSVQIRVDESLTQVLERVRRDMAIDIKKRYNLTELVIPDHLASRVLAARLNGDNNFKFKIRKNGMTKGVLELL